MIKIEKTSIIGRYNLIDDQMDGDERYLRQLSSREVYELGESIMDLAYNKGD